MRRSTKLKSLRRLGVLLPLVLVPYFALVLYLAFFEQGRFPGWARWVLPCCFAIVMIVLSFGFSISRKKSSRIDPQQMMQSLLPPRIERPAKRLLILYLVFFPLVVIGIFLERDLPIKDGLVALIAPILIMFGLWALIKRARAANHR
jgi:Na+/H+ antiporter NhaD/arsenite permease-like protein